MGDICKQRNVHHTLTRKKTENLHILQGIPRTVWNSIKGTECQGMGREQRGERKSVKIRASPYNSVVFTVQFHPFMTYKSKKMPSFAWGRAHSKGKSSIRQLWLCVCVCVSVSLCLAERQGEGRVWRGASFLCVHHSLPMNLQKPVIPESANKAFPTHLQYM